MSSFSIPTDTNTYAYKYVFAFKLSYGGYNGFYNTLQIDNGSADLSGIWCYSNTNPSVFPNVKYGNLGASISLVYETTYQFEILTIFNFTANQETENLTIYQNGHLDESAYKIGTSYKSATSFSFQLGRISIMWSGGGGDYAQISNQNIYPVSTVMVHIGAPLSSGVYTTSYIHVSLSATTNSNATIDKIWYNCKNGSSWIYTNNLTYTIQTSMIGFVYGNYNFYAWANDTSGNIGYNNATFTITNVYLQTNCTRVYLLIFSNQ